MVARTKKVILESSTSIALAVCLSMPVLAQGTGTVADEAPDAIADGKDPIVVTGTRIALPEAEAPFPISTLSAELIERSGKTNLTDLLIENPALVSSTTSIRSSGSRALPGGSGVNLLNLRNLGVERTLVLVNGRRHVASLGGSAAVDINTIPIGLVEKIDVLTGGVSPIYGADGVSGVVNFVMRRDFEGIEMRGQNGISSRGDAAENFGALTVGKNFAGGAGNISASYEYRRSARVRGDQRKTGRGDGFAVFLQNVNDFADDPSVPDRVPYRNVRFFRSSPLGAVDTNFDFLPDYLGNGTPYDPGMIIPNSNGLAQGGDGTPVSRNEGDLQPAVTTHNLNLLANYEFSPALRLFAEGKFISTRSFTEGQPTLDNAAIIYAENPYLPGAIRSAIIPGLLGAALGAPPGFVPDGALLFRNHFDLGRRTQRSKRETWRGVIGADGAISDHADYEIAYVYGRTTNHFVDSNQRIADRYFAALDAVSDGQGGVTCRSSLDPTAVFRLPNYSVPTTTFVPGPGSGCAPLNLFGENGVSDEALAFVMTDLANEVKLTQHVVTASVTGDFGAYFTLPGGPISFSVGGEYRKESSDFTPDQLLQDGVILDRVAVSAQGGSFDVWEGFAELQAPVLRDVPGAHLLQFGAAIRLSDYSSVGTTTTWKVDGTYAPVRDVRLRATYSESVRAPDINELFTAQSGFAARVIDPCDVVNLGAGTDSRGPNCAALLSGLGIDAATYNPSSNPAWRGSIGGLSSGNLSLQEETAKTWTAGAVFTPSFVPRLMVSFDWYDIKLQNAISSPSAQEIIDLCVDQPSLNNPFCNNVSRNPATGFLNGFLVAPANVSRFRSSGADVAVNYSFEPTADMGLFNLHFAGGYLDKLSFIATPGAAQTVEREEVFAPKWSGNFDLTWTKGNLTANYGISYFSKTRRFSAAEILANPDIADSKYFYIREKWEHDIRLAVDAYDDRVTFYGGVNNLFDRRPVLDEFNYPVSFRGRFVYFGIKASLSGV